MPDTFAATIQLAVIAMAVVFGVLIVLGLLITLSRMVFGGDNRSREPKQSVTEVAGDKEHHDTAAAAAVEEAIPDETVAVITAAICAYMGGDRRAVAPAKEGNPWLMAGRQGLMAARRTGSR